MSCTRFRNHVGGCVEVLVSRIVAKSVRERDCRKDEADKVGSTSVPVGTGTKGRR